MKLKIIRVGNSLGVLLPKRILTSMALQEGDPLFLEVAADPPRLVLRTSQTELEVLGVSRDDRREVDRFLELYSHLIRTL